MRHVRIAIALAIAVTGCDNGDNGPPSIATTSANVCSEVAAVACYNWYQCCSEGEIEQKLNVSDPRTQAQCRDDVQKLCERATTREAYSLAQGRVTFDASAADACLKALIAPDNQCSTVSQDLPWAAACMEPAWVGAVAVGGECDYAYECAMPDANDCSANRHCAARPALGQPCDTGCATGLYCNLGTCAMQLGTGGPCTSSNQCMKGLFCDLTQATPVCAALRDPGETCTGSDSCRLGNCLPGQCAGSTQQCFTNTQCEGHCNGSGAFCVTDANCGIGTCSQTPSVTCSSNTQCTGVGNTCVFPIPCIPGSCTGDVVCADVTVSVDYCTDVLSDLPLPAMQ
jgi:hypothetical protein